MDDKLIDDLCESLDKIIKRIENMSNTLEFTIPDGYELDKENSTGSKLVYKKKEEYKPNEGDLVYVDIFDRSQKFIFLYGENYHQTPSLMFGLPGCENKWHFHWNSCWVYTHIRPASTEEAALFSRIMSENGYEYDPEKKEVRKKRWRAGHGEPYLYVSEIGSVCEDREFNTCFDCFRHNSGNYFRLSEREEAEEVAAEFRKILEKHK